MAQITTSQLAEELESDARTVRKFLRSTTPKDEQPGKGSRWAISGTKRDLTRMRKQFTSWREAQEARRRQDEEAEVVEVEEDLDD